MTSEIIPKRKRLALSFALKGEVKEGSVVAWAGHATYGSYLGSVTVGYGTMSAV